MTILPADWPTLVSYSRDGKNLEATARLERVALKTPMPYVPDLDRNHAQIERLFAAALLRDESSRFPIRDEFELVVGRRDADPVPPTSRVRINLSPEVASESPETMNLSGPILDAAILSEFRTFMRPLLGTKKLDITWELLGGDEFDGKIVYVVQQEVGERRIRWLFDLTQETLSRVVFTDKDGKNQSSWTAAGERPVEKGRLPVDWEREANGTKTPVAVSPVTNR